MLLTISTNHQPATDLGYLLHKHPDRCQSFDLSFGKAHVFYPEASAEQCVACLLLDVDAVGLVRGKGNWKSGPLDQYVNDRPYVASSLMSVAISQVFGSALSGRSKERAELVGTEIPLTARLDVLPVRDGKDLLKRMFEPLGYTVTATQHPLDEQFPDWGEGHYFSVELSQTTTVAKLMQHLYVLIPGDTRYGRFRSVTRICPSTAKTRPSSRPATRANSTYSRVAHVPRRATSELRCRRDCRSD